MISNELNILNEGGFFIKNNVLPQTLYNNVIQYFNKKDFEETYQPENIFYGNKYQAYPCYQKHIHSGDLYDFIKTILKKIIDKDFNLALTLRKVYSEELLKSKVNTKYGLKHKDDSDFAGVISLDQTVDGGTAFYYNECDKYPDIEIGAFPNRMVLYRGKRWHAPCHDYTFNIRKNICFFIFYK
jgi:hypothetical protein